ncbi:MAG: malto-oligosyltrehalose trehalohydrolase [Dehalococcoidales bacterium]|nr:malto-oligosyltrehalose trehalohydrolase [Dehalococcoidales bacterium]
MNTSVRLGATYLGEGRCHFLVWAPLIEKMDIHIISPEERLLSLTKDAQGYHQAIVRGVEPHSEYRYRLNSRQERPDPASRYQPQGVHGPSQVTSSDFPREDGNWSGLPLAEYVIYELHTGTFTEEGTFDAIIPRLDELKDLGITALELMPVAQFPGERNWGYDGIYPFAVQNSYGGPEGLKRLVNACHRSGMAVVLDVVYNHLGPEGNSLADFAPYFTDRYRTPWGAALNFDGPYSDGVRRFFIENAIYWLAEFRIDALRLDALHAILDISAYPFLEELSAAFHKEANTRQRNAYLIGESTANDARLIRSPETGGYGLDAQWNDDFHHALHVLLTGERQGYYQDFGQLRHLAKAFREGFVYSGEYSLYRQRRHGVSSADIPADRFVVFSQNHDLFGNRVQGERLSQQVSFEALKLAAGVTLLSPFLPLLFMGEEYGETAPFPYFVSHSDPELVAAVRKGRHEEFAAFQWQGELPDPQDEATFRLARLNHDLRGKGQHRVLLELYKELLRLRRESPALSNPGKDTLEVQSFEETGLLLVRRWHEDNEAVIIFSFNRDRMSATIPVPAGRWQKRMDSAEKRWLGEGSILPAWLDSEGESALTFSPWELVLFQKEF